MTANNRDLANLLQVFNTLIFWNMIMVTAMDSYDKLKIYCIRHPFMKMLFACIFYTEEFIIKKNSYFDLSLTER